MENIIERSHCYAECRWDGGGDHNKITVHFPTVDKAIQKIADNEVFRSATCESLTVVLDGGGCISRQGEDESAEWMKWRRVIGTKRDAITKLTVVVNDGIGGQKGDWKVLDAFDSLPQLTELTLAGSTKLPFSNFITIMRSSPKLNNLKLNVYLEEYVPWRTMLPTQCLQKLTELTIEGDAPFSANVLKIVVEASKNVTTLNLGVTLEGYAEHEMNLYFTFRDHPSLQKCRINIDGLFQNGLVFTAPINLQRARRCRHKCSSILRGLSENANVVALDLKGERIKFLRVPNDNWQCLFGMSTLQNNIKRLKMDFLTLGAIEAMESNKMPRLESFDFGVLVSDQLGFGSRMSDAIAAFLSTTTSLKHLCVNFYDFWIAEGVEKGLRSNKSLEAIRFNIRTDDYTWGGIGRSLHQSTAIAARRNAHLVEARFFEYAQQPDGSIVEPEVAMDPTADLYCKVNKYRDRWDKFVKRPSKHLDTLLEVAQDARVMYHFAIQTPSFLQSNASSIHRAARRMARRQEKAARKAEKRQRKEEKEELKCKRKRFEDDLKHFLSTRTILDDSSRSFAEKNDALEKAYKRVRCME